MTLARLDHLERQFGNLRRFVETVRLRRLL